MSTPVAVAAAAPIAQQTEPIPQPVPEAQHNTWQQPAPEPQPDPWQQPAPEPQPGPWQQPAPGPQNNQWQNPQPGPNNQWQGANPERPWETAGPNNQWQNQQPGPNNPWQTGPQPGPNPNDPNKKKKKKSPVFVILIILFSLIIIGLVVLMFLIMSGKLDSFGQPKTETSSMESSSNPSGYQPGDENTSNQGNNSSGETSESSMSFSHDDSSDSTSDSSGGTTSESSEGSSESIPEPTSFTLSCGAEIEFTATSVDLTGYNVTDLVGIEQAPNLQTLIVNQGTLTDLSPLVNLPQLTMLTLNNLPISDISALMALPNLTYLNIKDTMLTADTIDAIRALKPDLTIVGYTVSEYTLVAQDITWENANTAANNAGGHLVTITSQEEYNKIVSLLGDTKLLYIWLGARSTSGSFQWVTGEPFEWTKWYSGEPSGKDADGTIEDCLCLWKVTSEWTENDQRNALNSVNGTSGKIGYIIEIERIWGYQP